MRYVTYSRLHMQTMHKFIIIIIIFNMNVCMYIYIFFSRRIMAAVIALTEFLLLPK
jgi:hypothetical protein